MKLLAIDTATSVCAAALWCNDRVVAWESAVMTRGQSEELMPMISRLSQSAEMPLAKLDRIVVTRGPGAFTGLRIGLSAGRAMALAAGCPCLGISTLEALAADSQVNAAISSGDLVLSVLDSKRNDLYVQVFQPSQEGVPKPLADAIACPPDALSGWLKDHVPSSTGRIHIAGDRADQAADLLTLRSWKVGDIYAVPAADIRTIAVLGAAAHEGANDRSATPVYLRPPDAAVPKNGGKIRP